MVSPPLLRLEGPKIERRPIILQHFQVALLYIFLYKPHFLVLLFNVIDPWHMYNIGNYNKAK